MQEWWEGQKMQNRVRAILVYSKTLGMVLKSDDGVWTAEKALQFWLWQEGDREMVSQRGLRKFHLQLLKNQKIRLNNGSCEYTKTEKMKLYERRYGKCWELFQHQLMNYQYLYPLQRCCFGSKSVSWFCFQVCISLHYFCFSLIKL